MNKQRISTLLTLVMVFTLFNFSLLQVKAANPTLKIGDYVQMGSYGGNPIKWRIIDIDTNGPLMLSDRALTYKMFDASGTNTANGSSHGRDNTNLATDTGTYRPRETYGSNYWADSNMRSWLNSTATAGNITWLCGNPPNMNSPTTYQNENGFLTNFTEIERNAIKSVTQRTHVSNLDIGVTASTTLGTSDVTGQYNVPTNLSFTTFNTGLTANYDTTYGQNVTDKIFLLDLKQLTNLYYKSNSDTSVLGKGYHTVRMIGTDAAVYSLLRAPSGGSTTKSRGSDVRVTITTDNATSISQASANNNGTLCAVRPAFYLDESAVKFSLGDGTSGSPYIVGDTYWKIDNVVKVGNNINISITKTLSESKEKLILAVYGENRKLINALYQDVGANTSYSFDISRISQSIMFVKVFLMEGLDTLRPIAEPKELPIGQLAVDKNYFPAWTRKAITFSFDDGTTSDERLIGIMNSAGLKGTFNFFQNNYTYFSLPTNSTGNKDYITLMNIYNGHEIANHSKTHPRMYIEGLPDGYTPKTVEECISDIEAGKTWLESIPQIGAGKVKGFVWPYKDPLRPELTAYLATGSSGISYARPVTTTLTTGRKYDIPSNFLNWEFTTHHKFLATVGTEFLNLADDGKLKLFSVWGHAYEFANAADPNNAAYNPALDWSLMENFAALVNQRTDVNLWKATNIQICEYANALNKLEVYDTYIKNNSNTDLYIKVNGAKVVIKANSVFQP